MSQALSDSPTFFIEGQKFTAPPCAQGLHIVATPIGNLADITLRALQLLASADIIMCEDTRITSRLLQRYQISTPLKPYHDHNGDRVRPKVIEAIQAGKSIVLVSDAGTPLVSDPGFKLVSKMREMDLPVHMAPGPSAPIMALALSGFPSDIFQFVGFLPPKSGARKKVLQSLNVYHGVSLVFESPKRIQSCLADMVEEMPLAQLSISRELTKRYEEVLRGTAQELLDQIKQRDGIKGEITIAIFPPRGKEYQPDDSVVVEALTQAAKTMSAAKAAHEVAQNYGLKKRDLYNQAITIKAELKK